MTFGVIWGLYHKNFQPFNSIECHTQRVVGGKKGYIQGARREYVPCPTPMFRGLD
jgi:hypothetical protein